MRFEDVSAGDLADEFDAFPSVGILVGIHDPIGRLAEEGGLADSFYQVIFADAGVVVYGVSAEVDADAVG